MLRRQALVTNTLSLVEVGQTYTRCVLTGHTWPHLTESLVSHDHSWWSHLRNWVELRKFKFFIIRRSLKRYLQRWRQWLFHKLIKSVIWSDRHRLFYSLLQRSGKIVCIERCSMSRFESRLLSPLLKDNFIFEIRILLLDFIKLFWQLLSWIYRWIINILVINWYHVWRYETCLIPNELFLVMRLSCFSRRQSIIGRCWSDAVWSYYAVIKLWVLLVRTYDLILDSSWHTSIQ